MLTSGKQRLLLAFVTLLVIQKVVAQQPPSFKVIKVGGLFADNEKRAVQEAIFQHGIEMVNNDKSVLLKARLTAQVEKIAAQNSMKASKKLCQMIQPGLAAVFGPRESAATANHIQSVAEVFHLPHIETRWDYNFERPEFSINLHPHPASLGKAYADLVTTVGWKSLVIVYQDEESLIRLQELIKLPKHYDDVKVTLRQLYTDTDDYRPLLKEIKKSGETRIVLDCDFNKIESILEQANEVGIVNDYHNYLITSLVS